MEKPQLPLFQVRLAWATRHTWKARQTLQFAAPATALWLVQDGEIEVGDAEHSWHLSSGQAFLWSATSSRRIFTPGGATWLSLGVKTDFLADLNLHHAPDLPARWEPSPAQWQTLQACARELIQHWHGGEAAPVDAARIAAYTREMDARKKERSVLDVLIAESLARAIFGLCWRHLAGEEAALVAKRLPLWLSETLHRIHDEPHIGIAELSHRAGFSPAQFRRLFQAHIGFSPREYVLQHRLDLARHLLEEQDWPVSAVAAHCGFSSLSHFIHIFKRTTGLSPARYRNTVHQTGI